MACKDCPKREPVSRSDPFMQMAEIFYSSRGPVRTPALRDHGVEPDFVGYAALFNHRREARAEEGTFSMKSWHYEPGCFDGALSDGRRIVAAIDFSDKRVIASTADRTLQLEVDPRGLRVGIVSRKLRELNLTRAIRGVSLAGRWLARMSEDEHATIETMQLAAIIVLVGKPPVAGGLTWGPFERDSGTWLAASSNESWRRLKGVTA